MLSPMKMIKKDVTFTLKGVEVAAVLASLDAAIATAPPNSNPVVALAVLAAKTARNSIERQIRNQEQEIPDAGPVSH